MRAVVVGCGIVGAGAALALARRGWRVTVVDRERGPGRGSTARSSSVVRCHYTTEAAIVLALEGRAVWRDWARFLGIARPRARYVEAGVLFLFKPTTGGEARLGLGVKAEVAPGYVKRMVALENRLGVGCEFLRGAALARRFPFFAFDGEEGLYEPASGYVAYPDEAVADLVDAGRRAGVRYRFGARATAIETTGADARRVTGVRVGASRLPAEAVLNAAGPWSHEVNVMARCPLPLTTSPLRQCIVEAELESPADVAMPATADLAKGFYLRPDPRVFKIGALLPRDHVDFVRSADAPANREALSRFREKIATARARVPGLRLRRVRVRPAFYDWTVADSYPILDGTDVAGYFVAIGTSGAWFKSGPVIGELAAERIMGNTRVRLARCGRTIDLGTFGRGRAPIA